MRHTLTHDLSPGDSLEIDGVTVTLKHKTGARARLVVDVPSEKKVTLNRRRSAMNAENAHGKHPVRQGPSTVP